MSESDNVTTASLLALVNDKGTLAKLANHVLVERGVGRDRRPWLP